MPSGKEMSITRSAVTTIAMRWIDRLIGMAGTLILARLLVPEDFGIVAQAALSLGLVNALTDLGVNVALIQNSNADQHDYDTAWTIRMVQYAVVAFLILVSAPLAGDYFNDDRVVPVLRALTLTLVFSAVENVGVVSFQKEMRFDLEFRFILTKRVVLFLTTVSLALAWRSYWTLIVGMIASSFAGVVLSYTMHEMRPRLSVSRFREIISISQWTLMRSVGAYLDNNVDRVLLGGRGSSAIVGEYTVANEISAMPAGEILAPINRVLFPAFAKAKSDLEELKRIFLLAQGVQSLVAIPAAVGLGLVAVEAVDILLGPKWALAAPLVQILCVVYGFQALTTGSAYVLMSLGHMKYVAITAWVRLTLFLLLAGILLPKADAKSIALIRLVVVMAGGWILFCALQWKAPIIRGKEMVRAVYRPIAAVLTMTLVVLVVGSVLNISTGAILAVKIAVGAATYVASVTVLWLLAGRPIEAETYVYSKLSAVANLPRVRQKQRQ